jgi:hypothetical protein
MRVSRLLLSFAGNPRPLRPGWVALVACVVTFVGGATSRAAVSLLLEQPYGKLNLINPAGHSAIYLDHVCAETPVKLRPCRVGEAGVVLSRYHGIRGYDWVAMPLVPYLYAVNEVPEIPESIDRAGEIQLREVYRRQYLQTIAPDRGDGSAPGGNWYELLGSAFDRTIYGFRVNTTATQDAQLIAAFNDRKNIELYNGLFHNCADFARVTLNRFYPHAVRRNYIADFGLTSPKSVARSLSHYAAKHLEAGLKVFMIPQVRGDLPRSHSNADLVEGILKRYGVPLVVVSPISTAVVFAAYIGHGRFSMPRHPLLLDLSEIPRNDSSSAITRPFPQMAPVLPRPALKVASIVASARPTVVGARSAGVQLSTVRVELAP